MMLPKARSAVFPLFAFAVLFGSAPGGARFEAEPVALVAALEGDAHVALPAGGAARRVALFDRLPAGARIETDDGSSLLLVYRSGARVRVRPGGAVILTDGDVTIVRGTIERLSPVPPLPAFDPPAAGLQRPGIAAVRIRGNGVDDLYPSGGARALADATVLAFAAPGARDVYTVEIEDAAGGVVFTVETGDTRVAVPPGTLEPGREYVWRVSARTPAGVALRGEAAFATLAPAAAGWRADARRAVGSPGAPVWLAEIDLALGLWREAQDGFRAATGRVHGGAAAVVNRRLDTLADVLDGRVQ
jgi:hypothetical protein